MMPLIPKPAGSRSPQPDQAHPHNPQVHPTPPPHNQSSLGPLKTFLREQESIYLNRALAYTGGDKEKAAQLLGVSLATLYRKLSEDRARTWISRSHEPERSPLQRLLSVARQITSARYATDTYP
jgi:DNA-binding NtrC family response regulator